jgi:hypothetical protein
MYINPSSTAEAGFMKKPSLAKGKGVIGNWDAVTAPSPANVDHFVRKPQIFSLYAN